MPEVEMIAHFVLLNPTLTRLPIFWEEAPCVSGTRHVREHGGPSEKERRVIYPTNNACAGLGRVLGVRSRAHDVAIVSASCLDRAGRGGFDVNRSAVWRCQPEVAASWY